MSSGGKFYVLLPNMPDAASRLSELRREVDVWLRETFNGEIAVNLAHVSFASELFRAGSQQQSGFGDVLTELSFALNREKRRRGQSVLTDDVGWREDAFTIERDFWGVGDCVSCGKFPGDPENENLCSQCLRDVRVGRKLPKVRYVAYHREETPGEDSIPMPMGCAMRVLTEDELAEAGDPYLLTKLNDPSIHELSDYAGSFRYLANHVPVGDYGAQLSFEEIAKSVEKGRHLLGYVKADVDYLGILFAQGMRRDSGGYDTAAHVAALSRQLDLFFSGWMQHLLSQRSGSYDRFYTVFSGGDDLFLVGPWDKAADLAREVYSQFQQFVGENRDITLSAGVLFAKPRYPISRAAEDAEEELERAKEDRDRLTVLRDTLTWEEAPEVFAEIETLKQHTERMTSAFLYNLVEYDRLYQLWKEQEQMQGLRYKPLFAYNIARNLRKGDKELYRWADGLMQSLHSDEENLTMQHLGLIATYLLFIGRVEKSESNER